MPQAYATLFCTYGSAVCRVAAVVAAPLSSVASTAAASWRPQRT